MNMLLLKCSEVDLNRCRMPIGYITAPETKLGVKPAPVMTEFSSKGPNLITPEILKVIIQQYGSEIS